MHQGGTGGGVSGREIDADAGGPGRAPHRVGRRLFRRIVGRHRQTAQSAQHDRRGGLVAPGRSQPVTDVRRVQTPDLAFEVAEAGTGGRPLLLVHGFCGAKEDFTEYLDRLADAGWHAVAVDLRGHGGSDHPSGEDAYGLELFADDVWALAEALGWSRLFLLGHSMGGLVAQVATLRHPERVRALVPTDTTSRPPRGLAA